MTTGLKIALLAWLFQCLGTPGGLVAQGLGSFEGASIIADDGQFLGIVTSNKFDARSINNQFGQHGSKFSSLCIFNEFGQYGGKFSSLSPFNEFTSTPPKIITKDQRWAYLTTNKFLRPRVSPFTLIAMMNE